MAASTAMSATGTAAEVSADRDGMDLVAVAETGTNPKAKTLAPRRGFCFIISITMRKFIKILIFIIILSGVATLAECFYFRKNNIAQVPQPQENIPQSKPINSEQPNSQATGQLDSPIDAQSSEVNSLEANFLPDKFSLEMPFYSQAPLGKWDATHEEMCEEASVLNAGFYLLGEKISDEKFEAELQKFKKLEEKELGVWKSTTISELKKATDGYFEGEIKSKIIDNPTLGQIETEISAGHPVIAPLAGQDIGNPYFTPPGPVYHMLVVKGYDAENFITNDVGTKRGESYLYKKGTIMENLHDWNGKDIRSGEKRVLVLYE
ncbi:MAG: C39 family peptidase [Candidatus Moranbacteria bacterium]|nr:C39 family peptidase [Candidatus Moranbacteria bacterium]